MKFVGTIGNDRIEGGGSDDLIKGRGGDDQLYGLNGNDTIFGGAKADYLEGDRGDDVLHGGKGGDYLSGANGDDLLFGDTGADTLEGWHGADTIDAGDGADKIYGQWGADLIGGGAGNDELYGGSGHDALYGGTGRDYLEGDGGHDRLYGGDGADLIVDDGEGGDHLFGGAGKDTYYLGLGTIFGSDGPRATDFAFDSSGAAFISPLGSTVIGFEKTYIFGSNFDDTLSGGAGADTIEGWVGDDLIHGGAGRDVLTGSSGDNQVFGDAGDDALSGNGGYDSLYGGEGADTLTADSNLNDILMVGGAGADTFVRELGRLHISYADSAQAVNLDLQAGVGHGGDAEGDAYVVAYVGGSTVEFIGSAYNDTIAGGEYQVGGAGDDLLVAREDIREMTGGAGRDTFAFTTAKPYLMTVHDFQESQGEILDVSGVDARPIPGDQAFVFIGTADFDDDQPGQLRYEVRDDGNTYVQLVVGRGASPTMTIILDGVHALTAADFVL